MPFRMGLPSGSGHLHGNHQRMDPAHLVVPKIMTMGSNSPRDEEVVFLLIV